jgi:DNA primase
MIIPESKIEEIRSAANIVDTISEFVQLRKRGKNFLGLCPFHSEKTPSFTVSEEKQIYHCFGCHAGGNVFKFLMEYEKISFIEAVQELAAKYGIVIEYDEEKVTERQSEQEILYDINTEAAKYFLNNLLNSPEGETARKYFQERKIKLQTQRIFGLGYAINEWQHFVEYANEKKIDLNKAVLLGLIGKNNEGRLYDKYSGRIIFPIFSPNGRVVAFAGRILVDKENTAKYLNSPESPVYHKGKILYGLSHAKDEIRRLDKAILVEGYMDLISLYQNGIKNVVAVSGTALTEEQVQLLSRYTKNTVLLFDADTAGIKASMRSIELLLKKDIEVRIAALPSGEDPDSFINNYGKEKFDDLIKQAQNFLEYETAYYEALGRFDDPAKTTETIRELIKPISFIADELKRNILIKSISKKFKLRENLVEKELDTVLKNAGKYSSVNEVKQVAVQKNNLKQPASLLPHFYNLEKDIIKLLFEGKREIIDLVSQNIKENEFQSDIHKKLAELVYNAFKKDEELTAGALLEKITNEELQLYVPEVTFEKYSISKNWDEINPGPDSGQLLFKYAKDLIKKYRVSLIEAKIAENHKQIESSPDEEQKLEIMKLNRDLQKQRENILEEFNS